MWKWLIYWTFGIGGDRVEFALLALVALLAALVMMAQVGLLPIGWTP